MRRVLGSRVLGSRVLGSRVLGSRVLGPGVLAALAAAGGLGLSACGGPANYPVTALFSSAEGLFPGNAVEVLGVPRGTVTKVTPENGYVRVDMSVDGSQALPAKVLASLTTPQLLGEPSVELSPGYFGGPRLAPGAVIPESRTSVPESIGQLLKNLQVFLGKVNDQSVSAVVVNLAQDLQGQGQALNQLIANGAGTLQLLADKGNELGQLDGSLAQITATLRQRTAQVTTLLRAYATVGNVLAQDSGPLGDAISQLAQMSQQLTTLLDPNLSGLHSDISSITQVGRTLDRNLGSLDQGLSSSVALFAAAGRAYDPVHNWLNLNSQLAPGTTAGVLEGLVRDRLAGICRRVLANHSAGLSPSAISTLQTCGNPDSGYFDGLLSAIPDLLTAATGSQPPAPSPQDLIGQGAAQIPGLSPSQQQAVSNVPASQLTTTTTTAPSLSGPTLPSSGPVVNDQQANGGSGGLLGGLLNGLLGVAHFFGSLF
jgi:phospholipid/cholesterol/gamma-HCH transport system substrate-binding protein